MPEASGGLLVVDDEPFLQDAVAASLRFLGFEVTTADTGADAPGADPGAAARSRVGLRLPRLHHRGVHLRRVPAAQAGRPRAGPYPHPARRRLQPAHPAGLAAANAGLYQQGALTERAQVDEAMRRIMLEAQRMGRLVDDMLRLARLDQHPARQRETVDVSALAAGCVERARIADPDRAWQARIAPGLVAVGDEELLGRAVDNLLANVCAHTPAGTTAVIAAAHDGTVTAAPGWPRGLRVTLAVPAWPEPAPAGALEDGVALTLSRRKS